MAVMDELDKAILNVIQRDFPLEADPFAVVGEKVGLSGDEVQQRILALKEAGVIRRVGAVFNREALGWEGTLCAAQVPDDRLEAFVAVVNAIPGVTHNYRRSHDYNVWFTLLAPSRDEIDATLASIRQQTGVTDIIDMKAVRTFKISAAFDLE